MLVSTRWPLASARSTLLPASTSVRLGLARARASFKKGCSALKEEWEVMS